MSKKRKEAPQPGTLFNFFAPGYSEGNGRSKSKRHAGSSVDERRKANCIQPVKGGVKDEPEDRRLRLQEHDIIVIDSDDDDEVVARLIDDSSDAEIVGEPTPCKQKREPSGTGVPLPSNTKKKESPTTLIDLSPKHPFQQSNSNKSAASLNSISPKEEQDEWDLNMGDEELELLAEEDVEVKEEDLDGLVGIEDGEEEHATEPCPMCGVTFLDLDFSVRQPKLLHMFLVSD